MLVLFYNIIETLLVSFFGIILTYKLIGYNVSGYIYKSFFLGVLEECFGVGLAKTQRRKETLVVFIFNNS
ncbi:hypothetical protein GCM10022397_40860 [Flavivirga jejuensis]